MDNFVLIWIVIGIVLIFFEFIVPGAVLSFLGIAALGVGCLIYLGLVDGIEEITISFLAISIFLLLVVRSLFLKMMPGDSTIEDTNEEREFEGAIVKVVEAIKPEHPGRVKYRDTTWIAQSDEHLEVGQDAVIIKHVVNKFIVKSIG